MFVSVSDIALTTQAENDWHYQERQAEMKGAGYPKVFHLNVFLTKRMFHFWNRLAEYYLL